MKATHNLDTGKEIAGANHHRNRSLTVHFHYPLRDDRWMWHRKRVNRCFAVNTIVFSVISGHKDGICTYAGRAATKRFKRTVSHFPMCVCVCEYMCESMSGHLFHAWHAFIHGYCILFAFIKLLSPPGSSVSSAVGGQNISVKGGAHGQGKQETIPGVRGGGGTRNPRIRVYADWFACESFTKCP